MNINKLTMPFSKGLLAILPVYLTFYFIYWLIVTIESNLSYLIKFMIGGWYFPGLGLIIALLVIYTFGLLMQAYIGTFILKLLQKPIQKLPFIGDLYSSVKSLTKAISSSDNIKGQEVVMVDINGIELLGIITRKEFSNAPEGVVKEKDISAVYLPMSYQIGGFTVYVAKSKIRKVEMNQKEALKWALIGGLAKR